MLDGFRPEKVPFPYRTQEEYERSLRMPLGKDFIPSQDSAVMTKPTVNTKMGHVITPLERGDAFSSSSTVKKSDKKKTTKPKGRQTGDPSTKDMIHL